MKRTEKTIWSSFPPDQQKTCLEFAKKRIRKGKKDTGNLRKKQRTREEKG